MSHMILGHSENKLQLMMAVQIFQLSCYSLIDPVGYLSYAIDFIIAEIVELIDKGNLKLSTNTIVLNTNVINTNTIVLNTNVINTNILTTNILITNILNTNAINTNTLILIYLILIYLILM